MGAPPSNQHRIELLEKGVSELRTTLAEQIAIGVQAATQDLQTKLTDRLTKSLDLQAQLMEERMAKSREKYEGVMEAWRGEQARFQEEMRLTMELVRQTQISQGKVQSGLTHEEEVGFRPEGSRVGSGRGIGSGSVQNGVLGSGRTGLEVGGHTQTGCSGGTNWRFKKLDLPMFDGENPDGWILRAERFFNFYKLAEEEQVEAAIVALEGDALLWFQWENNRRPIRGWDEMKRVMLQQFRPTSAGSLYEQWLSHQQTTTVVAYRRGFIELDRKSVV